MLPTKCIRKADKTEFEIQCSITVKQIIERAKGPRFEIRLLERGEANTRIFQFHPCYLKKPDGQLF